MSPDRPGVILAGGIRSHQENYASAFASAGCRLLAVGVAPGLSESETGRHAELAASLGLPLLPLDQAVALPASSRGSGWGAPACRRSGTTPAQTSSP